MRPRRPLIAGAAALLAACGGNAAGPAPNGNSPFGVWQTRSGAVLIVPRQGNFTLCDPGGCASGEVRVVFAGAGANLLGFWSLPAARRLRGEVQGTGSEADMFQLATGKIPRSTERRVCGTRPCVLVGSVEEKEPERFSKIADY